MKVLLLNGSPRERGNTSIALDEMVKIFEQNGIETEKLCVGKENIPGCKACLGCRKLGKCVYDDIVNVVAEKLRGADGMVIASPVYYGSANGTLISLLDRLFYSVSFSLKMKVGASVVVARRGGCSATFDELNKYFTISGMPLCPSQYWNSVHGMTPGEANEDEEGLQTVRALANNMSFLMKSIALGKAEYGLPDLGEPRKVTNFIKSDVY